MPRRPHIAILGGGFSGAVTAINLAQLAGPGKIRVTVVNPSHQIGRGLAYRFDDDNLVLNVPAANMSILADDPDHFIRHCQQIDPSLSAGSFVSRRLYGEYLEQAWSQTRMAHPDTIETRVDEAISLSSTKGNTWNIVLASGKKLRADQVILATGHQPPRFPIPIMDDALKSIVDPWDFTAMHRLPVDQPVVILGTGHTAVDALFCLAQTRGREPIYLLSRHGLLPHQHRRSSRPPEPHSFPDYLCNIPATIRTYTRAIRQHVSTIIAEGGDWRDALNELRSHTPHLWKLLPANERQRFLRHLQAYWDAHRHRLAPIAAQRLRALTVEGRTEAHAGRIMAIQKQANGITITFRNRRDQEIKTLHASAIINCTGPSNDVIHSTNPLLAQLLNDGLIQPDLHGLGLTTTSEFQVIDERHKPVRALWYVGPMLKARLWEATAVPELREHAHCLARNLLSRLSQPTTTHFNENAKVD